MATIEKIVDTVASVGVVRYSMREIRDACGWNRLGKAIIEDAIPGRLRGVGLWWYPTTLPNSQNEEVLLMQEGSLDHHILTLGSVSLSKVEEILRLVRLGQSLRNEMRQPVRSASAMRRSKELAEATVTPEPQEWVVRLPKK